MNEDEFVEKIDGKFPYHDEPAWQALTLEGVKISSNAAFFVLHEMFRPPKTANVTKEQKLAMIDFWDKHYTHPLSKTVLESARAKLTGPGVPRKKLLESLNLLRKHKGQFNAMGILYFCLAGDDYDAVDNRCEEILEIWDPSVAGDAHKQ